MTLQIRKTFGLYISLKTKSKMEKDPVKRTLLT